MSYVSEVFSYAGQIKEFKKVDWAVYVVWIGLMFGLLAAVGIFLGTGYANGVQYPVYVWNIPLGIFIFSTAIAFDTIGHRTTYKEELQRAEALVHHVTIFAGITSTLLLCGAYTFPEFLRIPTLVFILLSVLYSLIDEAFHWHRYWRMVSDRVEMTAHFFIFVGHFIMIMAWWHWFDQGYPGVSETLQYLAF